MSCGKKHLKNSVTRPQLSATIYAALKQGQSASASKLNHKEKRLQVFHNCDIENCENENVRTLGL